MNQVIHIFRKDVRRHCPEIVLTLAALVGYTWREVYFWTPQQRFSSIRDFMSNLAWSAILVLLPATWWFLVFRVVQSESLVGDSQFWITRPYEWKKLLAAKALFVVVFINVPVLLAGIFLLRKAGFSVAPYGLGLLWMQLLLLWIPLLPLAALAAVTRNIAHGLLAMLAVALYVIGQSVFSQVLGSGVLSTTDASDSLQGAVMTTICVTTVCLQYARRRTTLSRVLLAAGGVIIFIIVAVTSLLFHGEREYPLPSAGVPPVFHLSLDEPPSSKGALKDEPMQIQLPIRVSGLPDGNMAHVNAIMVAVETADGFRWNSGWQRSYQFLFPGQSAWRHDFELDAKTFERVKSAPVKVRISLAATIFRDQDAKQVTAGSGKFLIPEVGRCWIDGQSLYVIHCLSPLTKPSTLLVRADPAASTCNARERGVTSTAANRTAWAWEWNGSSGPAEYGISPVEILQLHLSNRNEGLNTLVCPGTPLTISFPTVLERARVELTINALKLSDYRQEPSLGTSMYGFSIRGH